MRKKMNRLRQWRWLLTVIRVDRFARFHSTSRHRSRPLPAAVGLKFEHDERRLAGGEDQAALAEKQVITGRRHPQGEARVNEATGARLAVEAGGQPADVFGDALAGAGDRAGVSLKWRSCDCRGRGGAAAASSGLP
jgi:hypothetical protein